MLLAAWPAVAPAGPPRSADAAVPSAGQVASARSFAAGRAGTVSWAVIDSNGRLRGRHMSRHHPSASVSKALILLAYLRSHRQIDSGTRGALAAMIRASDNDAAWAIYRQVGDSGLLRVARAAHLRRLQTVGWWSDVRITAADMARLFWRLDGLLPPRHRSFGRTLLRTIVLEQRWGIPRAAGGLKVLFKGGWRKNLAHQAARVEDGRGRHLAIAVLTEHNPSQAYGQRTIEGIAARLLAGVAVAGPDGSVGHAPPG